MKILIDLNLKSSLLTTAMKQVLFDHFYDSTRVQREIDELSFNTYISNHLFCFAKIEISC